jgi:hypothetical protein
MSHSTYRNKFSSVVKVLDDSVVSAAWEPAPGAKPLCKDKGYEEDLTPQTKTEAKAQPRPIVPKPKTDKDSEEVGA